MIQQVKPMHGRIVKKLIYETKATRICFTQITYEAAIEQLLLQMPLDERTAYIKKLADGI